MGLHLFFSDCSDLTIHFHGIYVAVLKCAKGCKVKVKAIAHKGNCSVRRGGTVMADSCHKYDTNKYINPHCIKTQDCLNFSLYYIGFNVQYDSYEP